MKPQALVVQKITSGRPSSWAASRVKFMIPSATMHVTGGEFGEELSFAIRSLKGARQVFLVDLHSDGMCCVGIFASVGGRPSGIVSNLKEGRPSREFGPRDFSRHLWMNSVLTKVI